MASIVRSRERQHEWLRYIPHALLILAVSACAKPADTEVRRLEGDALNDTSKAACRDAGLAWVGGMQACLTPDEIERWKTSACGDERFYICEARGFPPYEGPDAGAVAPSSRAAVSVWICYYDPTMDRDWHNDVLCTNGLEQDRPYLRPSDSYVTKAEIMESAEEYERQLNRS